MCDCEKADHSKRRDLKAITCHIVKEALILAVAWWIIVKATTQKELSPRKLLLFMAVYIPGMIALNVVHVDLCGQLFTACAAVMGAKLFELVKP